MIFLTFDIEEFDSPLPHSQAMTFEQQMEISKTGTIAVLDLLAKKKVKSTFFCTAIFAQNAPDIIYRIVKEGHELASHGYFHNKFEDSHLVESKKVLERISGQEIDGFRMPFMGVVDIKKIAEAGYKYDSSMNPTYIPGNYNNITKPRRCFYSNGIFQIPTSVSPFLRIPLFWLSLHNLPMPIYSYLCQQSIKKDGYLNIYLHPWEFNELDTPKVDLPWYIKRNSGQKLMNRLEKLIDTFQDRKIEFGSLNECQTHFWQ